MLEIMGQASSFRRVILASHPHCNRSLDARSGLVHTHVDFEAVVQGVNLSLAQISLYGLILPVAAGRQHCAGQYCKDK